MRIASPRTLLLLSLLAAQAQSQPIALKFVPTQTVVNFTLGDVLHRVHGQFTLRSGEIAFDPVTNNISGNLVVNAASGNSGNGSRDKKMRREVLESEQYPDISFRPLQVEGKVAATGNSPVQVRGMFAIHGVEHELTVPAGIDLQPDHWKLTVHFAVPYVKWGLHDPSTFILRVEKIVSIDLEASGVASQEKK